MPRKKHRPATRPPPLTGFPRKAILELNLNRSGSLGDCDLGEGGDQLPKVEGGWKKGLRSRRRGGQVSKWPC